MGATESRLMPVPASDAEAEKQLQAMTVHEPPSGRLVYAHIKVKQYTPSGDWQFIVDWTADAGAAFAVDTSDDYESEFIYEGPSQAMFAGNFRFNAWNDRFTAGYVLIARNDHFALPRTAELVYASSQATGVWSYMLGPGLYPRPQPFSGAQKACYNTWQALTNLKFGDFQLQLRARSFVGLVTEYDPDLFQALNSPDPTDRYTVFVPDDAAINAFFAEHGWPGSAAEYQRFLRRHVLPRDISGLSKVPKDDAGMWSSTYGVIGKTLGVHLQLLQKAVPLVRRSKLLANGQAITVIDAAETSDGHVYIINAVIPPPTTKPPAYPPPRPPGTTDPRDRPLPPPPAETDQYGSLPLPETPSAGQLRLAQNVSRQINAT